MPSTSLKNSGSLQLLLIVLMVGIVWLIALPMLSQRPRFQAAAQRLEERGIDPSAKFYTEHDSAWQRIEEMDSKVAQFPAAFGW